MGHEHKVFDTDAQFKINPVTRQIQGNIARVKLVQGDKNSARFTFRLPRYIDHDMSLCNAVEVHYTNVAETGEKSEDVYTVDDLRVDGENEATVLLSWVLNPNATKYAGKLNFIVKFKCIANGVIDYEWNTVDSPDIVVAAGKSNTEAAVEAVPDVLAQWRNDLEQYGEELTAGAATSAAEAEEARRMANHWMSVADSCASSSAAHAKDSKAEATKAANSATEAKASEQNAANAANTAGTHAQNAEQSANNAAAFAGAAENDANAASESEKKAESYANSATAEQRKAEVARSNAEASANVALSHANRAATLRDEVVQHRNEVVKLSVSAGVQADLAHRSAQRADEAKAAAAVSEQAANDSASRAAKSAEDAKKAAAMAGGGGAQPDWNAAEGEPGHVLNRPFYTEGGRVEILPETTVPFSEGDGGFVVNPKQLLDAGKTYVIGWNGVEYSCVAVAVEEADANGVMLGNIGLMAGTGDTGEPFVLMSTTDPTMGETVRSTVFIDITGSSTEVSVSITGDGEIVHKLPEKFLPDGVPYVGKGEPVELLPATEAQATDDGFFITSPINGVEVGKTYIVNYNGTDYKGIAKDASAFAPNSAMLGNSSVLGFGEDSGEPFLFVVFPPERLESDGFSAMIAAVDGASSVTLSISLLPEKLNKIDPRLLPDGVISDVLIVKSVDDMETATHTPLEIEAACLLGGKACFFAFADKTLPLCGVNGSTGQARFSLVFTGDDGSLWKSYVVIEADGAISDFDSATGVTT